MIGVNRNYLLLVLLLIAWRPELSGQSAYKFRQLNFQVEGKAHYGFFAHHHLEMYALNKHFPAYELILQRATFGQQHWEALYRYPLIGISAWYSPMGQMEEMGASYALIPFINFPLNDNSRRSLNFRTGLGLAYLTEKFHPIENYRNFAIGSHINVAVSLYFDYRHRVSDFVKLTASVGLTHFSNGSMKTPNYGFNIPTLALGISSFLYKPNPYLDRKLLPELYVYEFDGKRWFSVEPSIAIGYKDMQQQLEESFMVYHLAVNIMKPLSMKGKLGVGIDATYDVSHPHILERRDRLPESNWQIIKPGITAIYEMVMSKTSFVFQLGAHVGGAEQSSGIIYQKLGLKHYVHQKLFASVTLTAHVGRADYIGFGLGYRFDFKYY